MAAMAKAGAFSMLAETAEEFIQLECARRRNQASLKRRMSLPSQFHVFGHKSRLKEKLAQARRHAFLLRADNKAALVGIIDTVRELANNGEECGDGSKSAQRNGASPLERDRFMSWAADIEKLLSEFEPSENHADDPLLRILEHLQFLQDGHVCLAEVAMDARALLERWDRAGVFDSESSSEDEDNDDMNDHIPDNHAFLPLDPVKESLRRLEQSYAYQNVRQRAAASIIKRNVLTWVRSKASFCDRVAEIEIFGRTTEALLKELSLTTAAHAGADPNGNTDIFALATGRCNPKSRYSGSIAFKDLLQFSKHMALFPVDQALRVVEDVTRRRYLFDSRCAMKIQAVWRQVRKSVRERRLRRAIEELRLQREWEAQAKREAAKETKKRKASEAGKLKVTKVPKRSSTARSSVISSAVSKFTAGSTPLEDEEPNEPLKELSPPDSRESVANTGPKRKPYSPSVPPIDTSNSRASTRGNTPAGFEDKAKSPASTPRSRQRAPRGIAGNNNDSDDDTTDVEAAWKSFMDTVAADMPVHEVSGEMEGNIAPEEVPASDPMPPVTLPPMEDTWESWSDDEIQVGTSKNVETDDKLGRPPTSSKPVTPSTTTTPRIKIVVSVNKSGTSEAAARRLHRKEATTPRRNQTRPRMNPGTPAIRPPSSLPFDATLQNHTGPYTGAGQLSLMAPFVDADRSQKSHPSVAPERKHLYELDFSCAEMKDASFAHVARALGTLGEPEVQTALGVATADAPRASSRTTTVARLRSITGDKEQSARVRNLLSPENQAGSLSNEQQARDGDSSRTLPRGDNKSNQPGYIVYGAQGMDLRREVVLRKGTMVYSPLSGPPEEETTIPLAPGGKELKAWHRSTIVAIPPALGVPHPPVDRFRPRHKRRMRSPQHHTITTDVVDQIQALSPSAKKSPKRTEELPLLLRRSRAAARRREIERSGDDDNDDHPEIPAPEANKQTWKRGGELPELALAHIRDRVGYKRRPPHHRRMSIIAGRAPPTLAAQIDDNSATVVVDEQPETIFPFDEEGDGDGDGENEDSDVSADEGNRTPDEAGKDEEDPESGEAEESNATGLQRIDSVRRGKRDELSEEFQRLHLASRERELTRHRSFLAQLQSEEDAAAEEVQRRSKDVGHQESSRRTGRSRSQTSRSATLVDAGDAVGHEDVDTSAFHYGSSDDDSDARTRRRLRIKTRDAKAEPELSDDEEEDEGSEEGDEGVRDRLSMTQQERDAAFQKLLTQYLGLLQCSPAEVGRRL